MNINKTIHEAMGLCWHEWPIFTEEELFTVRMSRVDGIEVCTKCGVERYGYENRKYPNSPDYTYPVHYCELIDWMRGGDRIKDIEDWACQGGNSAMFIDFENWMYSTRQEQITLIAEAIEAGVLS